MKQKLLIVPLLVVATFFVLNTPALADYKDVLGVSTTSTPQIPATSEGPGFILPDSPLFSLDLLKQRVRLFFAVSPESKSRVYAAIAGERLAELRIELSRNNRTAIATDLQGVSENLNSAANELKNAKLLGNDTKDLSEWLNNDIKDKMASLDILQSQAQGELAAQTKAANATLLLAKTTVEGVLPADELAKEVQDDMQRNITMQVNDSMDSVKQLELEISYLNQQASTAAQEDRTNREKALQALLSQKDASLQQTSNKLLYAQLQKEDQVYQMQSAATAQAQKAIVDAKTAALEYQAAEQALQNAKAASQSVAGAATSK